MFFFSSRRRHTRFDCDWSSDVCSSDLPVAVVAGASRSPVEGLLAAGDRARWRHQLADSDSAVLYSAAALCLLRQALRPAGAGWLAAGLRGAQRVTRQAVLT